MSAIGQILDQVETLVRRIVGEREAEQDKRLDAVEKRLDALEKDGAPEPVKKATAATARSASATAKAAGNK